MLHRRVRFIRVKFVLDLVVHSESGVGGHGCRIKVCYFRIPSKLDTDLTVFVVRSNRLLVTINRGSGLL